MSKRKTLEVYQRELDEKFGRNIVKAKTYISLNTEVEHYFVKQRQVAKASPRRLLFDIAKYPEVVLGVNPRYTPKTLTEYQQDLDAKYGKNTVVALEYIKSNVKVEHLVQGRIVNTTPIQTLYSTRSNAILLTGNKFKYKDVEEFKNLVKERSLHRFECLHEYRGQKQPHNLRCLRCNLEWTIPRSPLKAGKNEVRVNGACKKCDRLRRHSKVCESWLQFLSKRYKLTIQRASNKGEHKIAFQDGTYIFADGYNKKHKIVFEFYGDVFHGNPKTSKPRSINHPYRKILNCTLFNATLTRERQLKLLGYEVVSIWQSDFVDTKLSESSLDSFSLWLQKTDKQLKKFYGTRS